MELEEKNYILLETLEYVNIMKNTYSMNVLQSKFPDINDGRSHSNSSGGWEQITKLNKKATLKSINTTLLIAPTAVTLTIMKLGS